MKKQLKNTSRFVTSMNITTDNFSKLAKLSSNNKISKSVLINLAIDGFLNVENLQMYLGKLKPSKSQMLSIKKRQLKKLKAEIEKLKEV